MKDFINLHTMGKEKYNPFDQRWHTCYGAPVFELKEKKGRYFIVYASKAEASRQTGCRLKMVDRHVRGMVRANRFEFVN